MSHPAPESGRYAVAVVGAGPAGIAAASHAALAGQRVVLIDQAPGIGGQIWRSGPGHEPGNPAGRWIERLDRSGAELRLATSVVNLVRLGEADFQLDLVCESRGYSLRANRVVIATGARERFLPFPGWTLPGVLGAGGAQALLKSGMSVKGRRVVVAGTGPLLLPVAASLAGAGARVEFVLEQASARRLAGFGISLWRAPRLLMQAVRYRVGFLRTRYRTGSWVVEARGDGKCEAVTLMVRGRPVSVPCDLLCVGFGLLPNTGLARLAGCRLDGHRVAVDEGQETSVEGIFCAGEPTGIGGVDLSLVEGIIAGLAAAGRRQDAMAHAQARRRLERRAGHLERAFAIRDELKRLATPDTIVCRCEDVRQGALDPRWTLRQARLYSRVGMGPCQGRICGALLGELYGWPPDPPHVPLEPAPVQALLGHRV